MMASCDMDADDDDVMVPSSVDVPSLDRFLHFTHQLVRDLIVLVLMVVMVLLDSKETTCERTSEDELSKLSFHKTSRKTRNGNTSKTIVAESGISEI